MRKSPSLVRVRTLLLVVSVTSLSLLAGCTKGPARIHPPRIDAHTAGAAAILAFDSENDGAISGNELDRVPSLKSVFATLDKNQDQRLTAGEVASGIKAWKDSKVGLMSLTCSVKRNGRAQEGVIVTLTPELFLGDDIKPASGQTDATGIAILTIAEQDRLDPSLVGVQCGYYQIRISKPVGGEETIPARYNVDTTLGCEITQRRALYGLHFELGM